jgi:hypothetical protein
LALVYGKHGKHAYSNDTSCCNTGFVAGNLANSLLVKLRVTGRIENLSRKEPKDIATIENDGRPRITKHHEAMLIKPSMFTQTVSLYANHAPASQMITYA